MEILPLSTENFDTNFLYQTNMANLMLLSGQAPSSVDAVFFHDRCYGDFTGLFEMAGRMYRTGVARFIATPNTDGARFGGNIPGEASPGKIWTREQLVRQGIPDEIILHPVSVSSHTNEENDAFLELSMKMKWRSAVILAQPHQLLREILGMVIVMNKTEYLMEIYTAAPPITPWYEVIRVNQGIETKPRIENIADELQRISDYQQKGDLATFDELFAYLKARDRGSLRFKGKFFPPELQGGLPV